MAKKTFLIIFLLIAFFIAGFFSGIFMKDETYKTVQLEFNQQLEQLQGDLKAAEQVTEKFEEVSKILLERNEEILRQSELIEEKEAELIQLKSDLASGGNGVLNEQIDLITAELVTLQQAYDKMYFETKNAQEELARVNNELQLKNEQVLNLQKQLNTGQSNLKKDVKNIKSETEKAEVEQKTTDYEQASKYEYKGDNYTGKKKNKNKDQNYFSAYYFFKQAGARIDMRRVKGKIKSRDIIYKINSGDFSNTKK